MKSINFDEGYKNYAVNGDEKRIVRVRVTDINLLKRVEAALTEIESLKGKYSGRPDKNTLLDFDKNVRDLIDKAFDSEICAPAFGDANICAPVSGGKLLFESFFEAFMPMLKADLSAAVMNKKLNPPELRPEVRKYVEDPVISPVAGLAEPYKPMLPDVSRLTPEEKRSLIAQLIT